MREALLQVARALLLVLMPAFLPVLISVTWLACFMKRKADFLEIEVILASVDRKVRAGNKGSKPR